MAQGSAQSCRDNHKLSIIPSVYFQICAPDAALVPTERPETEGWRVFAATALQPRNALPLEIRQATSVLSKTLFLVKPHQCLEPVYLLMVLNLS